MKLYTLGPKTGRSLFKNWRTLKKYLGHLGQWNCVIEICSCSPALQSFWRQGGACVVAELVRLQSLSFTRISFSSFLLFKMLDYKAPETLFKPYLLAFIARLSAVQLALIILLTGPFLSRGDLSCNKPEDKRYAESTEFVNSWCAQNSLYEMDENGVKIDLRYEREYVFINLKFWTNK